MQAPLKIHHGDPLPPVDTRPKAPARKYPLGEMQVGDVIYEVGRKRASVTAYISRITKGMTEKFEVRSVWLRKPLPTEDQSREWMPTTDDAPLAVEGVGIWRTE